MTLGGAYRLGSPDPVLMIELSITSWCNFRCTYCVTTIQPKRERASHAFDHHPVDAWVAAFERVPAEHSLICRGGEPFLDHVGFGAFLARVGALPRLHYIRIDTNGSWSPRHYAQVPPAVRAKIQLNVSFHPTQIDEDAFAAKLDAIVAAGWHVAMINYVMTADQADAYPRVRARFAASHGLFVNANPDAYDPAWVAAPGARAAGRARLASWLPPLDLAYKTGARTFGKPCFFPSIAYFVAPNGWCERACGAGVPGEPRGFDFVREPARLRALTYPAYCPQQTCLCVDRYAFLEDEAAATRGRELDLLAEYVRDCRAVQRDP